MSLPTISMWLSNVGFFVSLIGLVVTIFTLAAAKSASAQSKEAVVAAKNTIKKVESLDVIARILLHADKLQISVDAKKWDDSHLHCRELILEIRGLLAGTGLVVDKEIRSDLAEVSAQVDIIRKQAKEFDALGTDPDKEDIIQEIFFQQRQTIVKIHTQIREHASENGN